MRLNDAELYDYLHEFFSYDKTTGAMIRVKKHPNGGVSKVGDIVGGFCANTGYMKTKIYARGYSLHYMAYVYVEGSVPKGMVLDHIDRDGSNNKWSNIRLCTRSQNACNIGMRTNNSSGYKGVSWHKQASKWSADIQMNGKRITIGRFKTKEEAAQAYNDKALEMQGEFAFLNIINEEA